MSDPTAPDLPALPPEPEGAPQSEGSPASAPDPTPSPEGKPAAGWKGWVAAGAACGVVVVGGIYVTRDDDPAAVDTTAPQGQVDSFGGPGRGAFGEVTDIDGSTITLTSSIPGDDGEESEVTVETDDDTTFTDVVDGEVGDLAVGDSIVVSGEVAEGAVTAESVTEQGDDELGSGPMRSGDAPVLQEGEVPDDGSIRVFPGGQAPSGGMAPADGMEVLNRITMGEITAIDGDRFTVETPFDEEIVVTVDADTEVRVTEEISIDDLEEGDEIRVVGDREDDVVSADSVRRGDAPMVFGGPATGPGASPKAS